MSKELEYEFNNFANLLNKDCMNLMELLKKQDKDNKPILYLGKHFKKVILPYEEYQKMCNRLEAIDNANPSEVLKYLEEWYGFLMADNDTTYSNGYENEIEYNRRKEAIYKQYYIIKQALLNNQKENNILKVLKPLCKVKETPEKTVRYLLVSGTVAYVFKEIEEYEMFKEWLKDE